MPLPTVPALPNPIAAALKAVSGLLDGLVKELKDLIGPNGLSALLTKALGDKANAPGASGLIEAVTTLLTCVLEKVLDVINAVVSIVEALLSGGDIQGLIDVS